MPPVKSAPSSDVDNEATAELPVLDVAAYEATLSESQQENEHTDSWSLPDGALQNAIEATTEMPAVLARPGVPKYDLDHSGTHEMPAMPPRQEKRKHGRNGKPSNHSRKSAAPAQKPPVPSRADDSTVAMAVPALETSASMTAATPLVEAPVSIAPAPAPAPAPAQAAPPSPAVEELRAALAAAERRIEELQERARIADAERAVAVGRANAESAQLRDQLAAHLEALATARGRLGVQGTDQTELEDAYFARGDRITALERELAAHGGILAGVRAELAASQQRCDALATDGANLRATITHRNEHIARIEADMYSRQQREASLKARLDEALVSVNPDVPGLRSEILSREAQIGELKGELEAMRGRLREKDGDIEAAEESIRNLESELRSKASKLDEATGTVEEWRAVIAESQKSILERDSRIQRLEADLERRAAALADSAAMTGEEIALEGPARVLIRTDGNTEFVHVLGRRTRIGRGSDNELVLDTKHVSRYHAVLLAGPSHTSIEDLNSTNGVFVNNKRVTRQALKDGDRVTIGRSQFRYTVRD